MVLHFTNLVCSFPVWWTEHAGQTGHQWTFSTMYVTRRKHGSVIKRIVSDRLKLHLLQLNLIFWVLCVCKILTEIDPAVR